MAKEILKQKSGQEIRRKFGDVDQFRKELAPKFMNVTEFARGLSAHLRLKRLSPKARSTYGVPPRGVAHLIRGGVIGFAS
jgi:hypothetical protein